MVRWLRGYMGSGGEIKQAVAKYGKLAFRREILSTWDTEAEAYQAEYDTLVLRADDPLSYNILKSPPPEANYMTGKSGVLYPATRLAGRKNPFFGRKHTEASRAKMRGKRLPSVNMQGENASGFGRPMTEMAKIKRHLTNLKNRMAREANPVKPALFA